MSGAVQCGAVQSRVGQSSARQCRAGQSSAAQCTAVQSSAVHSKMVLFSMDPIICNDQTAEGWSLHTGWARPSIKGQGQLPWPYGFRMSYL